MFSHNLVEVICEEIKLMDFIHFVISRCEAYVHCSEFRIKQNSIKKKIFDN